MIGGDLHDQIYESSPKNAAPFSQVSFLEAILTMERTMGGEISPKFTLWIVNYSGGGQITGLASMQMSLSKQAPRRKSRPSAKQTRHANAAEKSFPEHELKLVPACLASLLHSLLLSVPCESGFWTVEK